MATDYTSLRPVLQREDFKDTGTGLRVADWTGRHGEVTTELLTLEVGDGLSRLEICGVRGIDPLGSCKE